MNVSGLLILLMISGRLTGRQAQGEAFLFLATVLGVLWPQQSVDLGLRDPPAEAITARACALHQAEAQPASYRFRGAIQLPCSLGYTEIGWLCSCCHSLFSSSRSDKQKALGRHRSSR